MSRNIDRKSTDIDDEPDIICDSDTTPVIFNNGAEHLFYYFYKGFNYPKVFNLVNATVFEKLSDESLENNFKTGKNVKQQIEENTAQLTHILTSLKRVYQTLNDSTTSQSKREYYLERFNDESIYTKWCVCILSLLRLKAIKDDNSNGVMIITLEKPSTSMKRGFLKFKKWN